MHLSRVKGFEELAEVAGGHHEKLDGTGYPKRLTAGRLSLEARILGIADIYGALTECPPYRSGFSPAEASRMIDATSPASWTQIVLLRYLPSRRWIGKPPRRCNR